MTERLLTPQGEALLESKALPWQCHPRPQCKRSRWLNLNGSWDFSAPDYEGSITLPFCPESRLSGVERHFPEGCDLVYCRSVTLPEDWQGGRVLLHIDAADQHLSCWVNGKAVGRHRGGYDNILFDITDFLEGNVANLKLICRDDLKDTSLPYGKQVLPEKRGGMWYTPVSGIWQSVWLEWVPEAYVQKLHIENRGASVTITTEPALDGQITVKELGQFPLENGQAVISPKEPHLWSPEDPYLYEFTLEAGQDRIESYFALRSLDIKTVNGYPRLCLNGKPYFFHGLLDQGYWPEGLLTPPAPESYEYDILAMKKLGFNTLRKHIKVEMEHFYYLCDKLGMVVFQDMVNNSHYSFFKDTALPTVGLQKCNDRRKHRDPVSRTNFLLSMEAVTLQLKNHPCILYWTIFNEGWGQFDSDAVYEQFLALDDSRWIDSTSGWFRRRKTQVDSRHVYFRKVKLSGDGKKPLVLSEFGGKTYKAEGHVFNPEKSYGYGGCQTPEALTQALVSLYRDEILPCVKKGLCAAIYTQVSDVEDEINGLVTYDRRVEKVDTQDLFPLAEALQQAIAE